MWSNDMHSTMCVFVCASVCKVDKKSDDIIVSFGFNIALNLRDSQLFVNETSLL